MSDRLLVVSTDCHAGLPIADYKPYVDAKYHEMIDAQLTTEVFGALAPGLEVDARATAGLEVALAA